MSYCIDIETAFRNKEKKIQAALGLVKIFNIKKIKSTIDISRKTSFQKNALKKIFKLTKYPSKQTRDDLALFLNLTPKSIQIWFQNERKQKRNEGTVEDESWKVLLNINVISLFKLIFTD